MTDNERIDGKVKQQGTVTLGRREVPEESAQLDGPACSCARYSERAVVLGTYRKEQHEPAEAVRFGPLLVFERLWDELENSHDAAAAALGAEARVSGGASIVPHRSALALRSRQRQGRRKVGEESLQEQDGRG